VQVKVWLLLSQDAAGEKWSQAQEAMRSLAGAIKRDPRPAGQSGHRSQRHREPRTHFRLKAFDEA